MTSKALKMRVQIDLQKQGEKNLRIAKEMKKTMNRSKFKIVTFKSIEEMVRNCRQGRSRLY